MNHAPSFSSRCQRTNRACASIEIFRCISAGVSSGGTLLSAYNRALVSLFSAPAYLRREKDEGCWQSRAVVPPGRGGCSHLCSPHMKSLRNCLRVVPVSLSIGIRLCCLHHMLDLDDLQCYHGNGFCLSIGENVS